MSHVMRWILEVSLITLWMAGMISGLGGPLHILALAAVVMVFTQDTWVEQKVRDFVVQRISSRLAH